MQRSPTVYTLILETKTTLFWINCYLAKQTIYNSCYGLCKYPAGIYDLIAYLVNKDLYASDYCQKNCVKRKENVVNFNWIFVFIWVSCLVFRLQQIAIEIKIIPASHLFIQMGLESDGFLSFRKTNFKPWANWETLLRKHCFTVDVWSCFPPCMDKLGNVFWETLARTNLKVLFILAI